MSSTTTQLSDIPTCLVAVDYGAATVTLTVDATIYPLQALYGAAYIFFDRCFVFLGRVADGL
jgi:hypothetical protein